MSENQDQNQGFDLNELIEYPAQATQQSAALGSVVGGIFIVPTFTASTEAEFNRHLFRVEVLLGLATNALERESAVNPNLEKLAVQQVSTTSRRAGVVQAIDNAHAVNKEYAEATYLFMFNDGLTGEAGSNADSLLRTFIPKFHQAALQLLYAVFGTEKESDDAVLQFIDTQGLINLLISEISLIAYEQTMNSAVDAYAEAEERQTGVRPGPFSLDKKLAILISSGLHPKSQEEAIAERPALYQMFSEAAENAVHLVNCAAIFFETNHGDEKRLQAIAALKQAWQDLAELYQIACESK